MINLSTSASRFLLHAAITLAALAVAVGTLALVAHLDVGLGPLVLRTQRGTSYSFPTSRDIVGAPSEADPVGEESPPPGPLIRNLVLVIGDGMGIGQVSSALALLHGPAGNSVLDRTEAVGLVRTFAADDLVTDSAASATAIATGFRTDRKMVSTLPDGRTPRTLFEVALERGLAAGVVTTSGLVGATPAAFLSHVPDRDSYAEILEQMLHSGAQVMLGGDWTRFRKAARNTAYCELLGSLDGLVPPGYAVVHSAAELDAADGPVIGLFPPRPGARESHGPPLAETTRKSLEILASDPEGFVVLIECEATDDAGHENDITKVVAAVRELVDAVAAAVDFAAAREDTLVVFTADHDTGGLAIVDAKMKRGRATVRWASHDHTAQWVPLFAWGPGAERFSRVLDSTELACLIGDLLGFEGFPAVD